MPVSPNATIESPLHLKDDVLARLATTRNVAQFVSFGPGADPPVRHAWIHDIEERARPGSVDEAIARLFSSSAESSVNVRSFRAGQPKSQEFIYGLTSQLEAIAAVRRLASTGLYTIANETVDVMDGGVSGVSYAGVLEFAPEDTPRCVEKPGTALLPRTLGLGLLESVYGFAPELPDDESLRVEFSIHPLRRGFRQGHTIIWEEEGGEPLRLPAPVTWPNRFSRFLGDKTYGLLIADAIGLDVPDTTALSRKVAPFRLGRRTSSGEHWIRTAPTEQIPGRFTTERGWRDPFQLLASEDPDGEVIASVLSQEGVEAAYSGAAAPVDGENLVVEGTSGRGEDFMQGARPPEALPSDVVADVEDAYARTARHLGAIRFEWVHDGARVWRKSLDRVRIERLFLTPSTDATPITYITSNQANRAHR